MNDLLCNEELRELILSVGQDLKSGQKLAGALKDGDKANIICKFAPIIIAALNIAKIFVGSREKEIINAFIDYLKTECQIG